MPEDKRELMMEQSSQEKHKVRGKAISPSIASLIEMEMQHEMEMARRVYPQLAKIMTLNIEKPIGRIMVVGTAGDLDTNGFENIWKQRNG